MLTMHILMINYKYITNFTPSHPRALLQKDGLLLLGREGTVSPHQCSAGHWLGIFLVPDPSSFSQKLILQDWNC